MVLKFLTTSQNPFEQNFKITFFPVFFLVTQITPLLIKSWTHPLIKQYYHVVLNFWSLTLIVNLTIQILSPIVKFGEKEILITITLTQRTIPQITIITYSQH